MSYTERPKGYYDNLHGKELVNAIIEDSTLGTKLTDEEYRKDLRSYEERMRKEKQRQAVFDSVKDFLRPIFFTPLAFLFHVITFVARIVSGISCIGMLYGFYCVYKAVTDWRAGLAFADSAKTAAALIVFPFIAYAVVALAEKGWAYFEDNKW